MKFYIREKVVGYRTVVVEANNGEEANDKWLKGNELKQHGEADIMSAELVSCMSEEEYFEKKY